MIAPAHRTGAGTLAARTRTPSVAAAVATRAQRRHLTCYCHDAKQQQQQGSTPTAADDDGTAAVRRKIKRASAKLTAVAESVRGLQETNAELLRALKESTRRQALQWAVDRAAVNSFEYEDREAKRRYNDAMENYHGHSFYDPFPDPDSKDLVKAIILKFIGGQGYVLPNSATLNGSQEEFREELCDQIHCLTGVEPRVEKDEDGDFVIYEC